MLWPIQGVTMSKGTARAFRRCATYGGGYDLIHSYRPSKSVQILINLSVDYRFDQEEALPRLWRRLRRGHLGMRTELMNNSSELHRTPKPNIFWKLMTNTIHRCHQDDDDNYKDTHKDKCKDKHRRNPQQEGAMFLGQLSVYWQKYIWQGLRCCRKLGSFCQDALKLVHNSSFEASHAMDSEYVLHV